MNFQQLKDISTEVERGENYTILKVDDLYDFWYGGRYTAYSSKWNCGEYVQHNTLEEARSFISEVNSKEPISAETIYNSKVISQTTEIPNWLSEYIGLNTYDLEDIQQSDITIKLHGSEDNIEILTVWYFHYPVMLCLRKFNKRDVEREIIVTSHWYQDLVKYLYNKYIEKRLQETKVVLPTEPNKDISLVWGYFIEDLLEKQ